MSLEVRLGRHTFAAADVAVERGVGKPVAWRAGVVVAADADHGRDLPELAAALSRDRAQMSLANDGQPLVGNATVVGARWRPNGPRTLEIEAHTTAAAPGTNIFRPRRRVHRVQSWRELAVRLEDVALLATGVRNHLETRRFQAGTHTSLIQDGESDWDFLANVVDQFARVEEQPELRRLALIGGNTTSESTERRWLINWGSGAGYERLRDVRPRHVRQPETGAYTRLSFSTLAAFPRHAAEFPTGSAPSVTHGWFDRPFSNADWERWMNRDVPFFVGDDESFAWQVVDRIVDAGQPGVVRWESYLSTAPLNLALDSGLPARLPAPWIGFGLVTQSPKRDSWIEVRLDGFEPGDDTVDARVTSPYSGTDGTKGLHLVPETGTRVALAWSGRMTEPLFLLGNVRESSAAFSSPALWLESAFTTQYADIACKSVGNVEIASSLAMRVNGSTNVTSQRPMAVTGDGCEVELRGGTFYTGKGM